MTNPPDEAAMQPRWGIILADGGTNVGLYTDEETAKNFVDKYYRYWRNVRISELMERAEHEREMAAMREENAKLRDALGLCPF
jgi:hypothetical protein